MASAVGTTALDTTLNEGCAELCCMPMVHAGSVKTDNQRQKRQWLDAYYVFQREKEIGSQRHSAPQIVRYYSAACDRQLKMNLGLCFVV